MESSLLNGIGVSPPTSLSCSWTHSQIGEGRKGQTEFPFLQSREPESPRCQVTWLFPSYDAVGDTSDETGL